MAADKNLETRKRVFRDESTRFIKKVKCDRTTETQSNTDALAMSIGYGIGIRTGATGIQSEEKTEQQPERDDELMLDFIQFHNIIICPHPEAPLLELLHIHNSSDDDDDDEDHPTPSRCRANRT